MKKQSTYDVVMASNWESHGSVTFPGLGAVSSLKGKQVRAGFYPCYGVEFKPETLKAEAGKTPTVYWWDGAKVNSLTHGPQAPRKLKLKVVSNPSFDAAAGLRQKIAAYIATNPSYEDYTPHVRMDDAFATAFSNVVFTEVAYDLLVSDELVLPQINVWERDGSAPVKPADRTEIGPFRMVFHMTHIEDPNLGNVMKTKAVWNNGYIAFYGCCRVLSR